eukprot:g2253.t1
MFGTTYSSKHTIHSISGFFGNEIRFNQCSRNKKSSQQFRRVLCSIHTPLPKTDSSDVSSNSIQFTKDAPSTPHEVKTVQLSDVIEPVKNDMKILNENLKKVVGQRHPMLLSAADQIFSAGGKKLRPLLVLLIAKATLPKTQDLTEEHRRLAEITEMIHTASLVHDDVIDECNVRRGKATVNKLYGTRVAVLVGDFLFAQSSWYLANLENLEVIKLISQVIADFANGEISQASGLFDTETTLERYNAKSFFKTASLIAASCRCSAVFSNLDEEGKSAMYDYGKHLGLAFQIVDDILDFTQSTEQLGKPQGQDLASGNLTAPVIFALKKSPELHRLIENEFTEDGDLEKAIELVKSVGGISDAMQFASEEAMKARAAIENLSESPAKNSLMLMVDYVLKRIY